MSTPPSPVFGVPAALPRGPHRLPRDQVAASQRLRLMTAIAEEVAERGYPAAKIADTSRRAGVSPRTFYEHFQDKLDCFLAAYDTLVGVLVERMGLDLDDDMEWHDFIASALGAYLETFEEEPAVARAFVVEIDGAGPVARKRRRQAYEQFAGLIKNRHESMRRQDPTLGPLPDSAYLAIVHGARQLVADALETERRPRLTKLAPEVIFWITATVRGAAPARAELAERQSVGA